VYLIIWVEGIIIYYDLLYKLDIIFDQFAIDLQNNNAEDPCNVMQPVIPLN